MRDVGPAGWLLANLLIVATAAFAWLASRHAPSLYYTLSQEDHLVEWATVWAFLLAAGIYASAARLYRRVDTRLPWFCAGVAAFCFVVAMEEMSWGQRLLTYRPPALFLADNYQQELNFHNVVPSALRQAALQAVIVGFGIVLPLARYAPWAARLGVLAPPLALIPAFAVMSTAYALYTLDFTGEWVELMLGLGFLFAAAATLVALRRRALDAPPPAAIALFGGLAVASVALGAATLAATAVLHTASPRTLAATQTEIDALAADFAHERVRTRCGVHKRVFTFQRQYGQRYLQQGAFAGLLAEGPDATRGRYFLDPWNMPYWVRHSCARSGRELVTVYSFGPNRRRDSTSLEIAGDDIGRVVVDASR